MSVKENTVVNSAPDGGYGWIVALCGMAFTALQTSYFSVYGAVYIELVDYYETDKATISWIGAIQQCMFGVSGLLYGPLARRFGGRRVGIISPFLVTAGYLASAFSSELSMLFVGYAFLAGIGLGGFGTVSISSVYPWFSRRRPLAVAIVMLGIPLGAFLWPPIVTQLVHVYAWRGAFIIVAGMHLQALVFFALIRQPPKVKVIELKINIGESDAASKIPDARTKPNSFCSWIILFANPVFPVLFFGLFLLNFGHVVPFTYTTARGILLGYTDTHSAILSSIIGIGSGVGRLFAGIFGSRADGDWRVKACATCSLLAGITSIVSYSSDNYWFLASYSGVWGFLAGIYAVCSWAIIVDLFGQTYAAEMTGFFLTCAGLAFLCTNVLTGFILDATGDPSLPFAIFGGVQILASCSIFLSFCLHKRRSKNEQLNVDAEDKIDRVSLASAF